LKERDNLGDQGLDGRKILKINEYKEHQISTRNIQPGDRHTQRGTRTPQYEDRKIADIFKILKSRTMMTYINEYY
jgi:hypothetical protein